VRDCIERTNWSELCRFASERNRDMPCRPLSDMTNGLHNVVRLLEFDDNTRWVARIQMARSTKTSARKLQSEVDVMMLLRERAGIPVPRVFGYEVDDHNQAQVAFLLMEFLPGNVAVDADGGYEIHQGHIPPKHREGFYNAVARIHVPFAVSTLFF